jgi:hypothetical protein
MRKAIIGMSLLAVACLQLPASAAPWFDRWDNNHDGYWNYEEYRAAQMNWCRHHHIKCDEARLRAEFGGMSHNGRVVPADAWNAHPW